MENLQLRFAVQILYYDCDELILRTIANCAQFVEKIYVVYSPEPWSAYNKVARKEFKNPSKPEILNDSPYRDKVELISGVWDTEEDQRNACLAKARQDGFDYLIVQDADEFYLPEEYEKNIREIVANPHYSYYRNPWYFFWKSTRYIVLNRHFLSYANAVKPYSLTPIAFNACFAINCKSDVRFGNKRLPDNVESFLMLSGICFHISYVLSDETLFRKLSTWGHSHQVNVREWYNVKWLGWTPETRNFHPINLVEWARVKKYTGVLPDELKDFEPGEQKFRRTALRERVSYSLKAFYYLVVYALKDVRYYGQTISKAK